MSIKIHIPDHILLEDEYILVLDKPASLMVEPDRNGHPNLLQQVKQYLKPSIAGGEEVYAQHIHRLDRPVRGVILFAKQRSVLKNLSEQFAERKVKKYYQALTDQAPPVRQDILEHWLRKEKKKAVLNKEEFPYAEQVKLSYQVEEVSKDRYLWDIELHTGKFHQIRAQLASLGCPIVGDVLYGSSIAYRPDSIALCAYKLIFHHPLTNQELVIEINEKFNN